MKQPKAIKYSDLKKKLKLDTVKEFSDCHASFTHYLQTKSNGVSHHYKLEAEHFFSTHTEETLNVQEPEFQFALPIKWDIPFPPNEHGDFSFIDLFAGIGGFRIALQSVGGKCVFSSEWNKYARKTYEANFGEVPFGDITKIHVDEIPKHDVLVGGFPCQPFSIAGVSKKNSLGRKHGFEDETQGTLFHDIVRIIKAKRPKAFLLENVKNLKSHDGGKTFAVIQDALQRLGYKTFVKILDAKYYVPQHRERIFIAGFNLEYFPEEIDFRFPEKKKQTKTLKDILEENPHPRFTLTDNLWKYLQVYAAKHKEMGNGFGYGLADTNGITRTLSARYYKDGSEILIPQGKAKNPRRLTPSECKSLMGFPKKFRIEEIGVSDMQLYKQFGNSVAVPLVQDVAARLIDILKREC